ncbi:unnamed protein product [Linum tenue]|uniref:SMP domain-containing protein n=2 Tax=Linum tenue TaxID=586396 RepID=A0AAV0P690_9ROSI|nr:unnamed protein product [Linum tenue]
MSQGQPRRPDQQQFGAAAGQEELDPIRYGDVFDVSGDLASKPIAPEDANMMQSAETMVFGQTQKGGPAAAMQSAATFNERAGLVAHRQATDAVSSEGVMVSETDIPGARIITESVGGQVLGQFVQPAPVHGGGGVVAAQNAITIGEALEATGRTSGDRPVDQSDAAAIQAAETRATGSSVTVPGGLAATAQSAATHNAATDRDEEKIKLNDVLWVDAAGKLPADKVVTREDAEGVTSAEMRNNPTLSTNPAGVAASMVAAASLNEDVVP